MQNLEPIDENLPDLPEIPGFCSAQTYFRVSSKFLPVQYRLKLAFQRFHSGSIKGCGGGVRPFLWIMVHVSTSTTNKNLGLIWVWPRISEVLKLRTSRLKIIHRFLRSFPDGTLFCHMKCIKKELVSG